MPEHNHKYIWTAEIHEYNTRQAANQIHYITNKYTRSETRGSKHKTAYLTEEYTNIWKTLPITIRSIQTIQPFKSKLKQYLLTKQ